MGLWIVEADILKGARPHLGSSDRQFVRRLEAGRSPDLSFEAESVRLIDSPLVAETADWLGGKAKELGSLLAADRAVEYVAILRAFPEFRQHHEPKPLHEDIVRAVCGEMIDPFAELPAHPHGGAAFLTLQRIRMLA